MTSIREASAADVPALTRLRYEFRSGIGTAVEDERAFEQRCGDWMRANLASGVWGAWVAESSGGIVGAIWMHVMEKVPNPVAERESHAYISNLYVRPEARGGTGTKLLEAALRWADFHGVDRVVLWPTTRSRSMYTRYGFVPEGDVMERTCP